jgi:hypothetical protein
VLEEGAVDEPPELAVELIATPDVAADVLAMLPLASALGPSEGVGLAEQPPAVPAVARARRAKLEIFTIGPDLGGY